MSGDVERVAAELAAHRWQRLPGGYVGCTCGDREWSDHRTHLAQVLLAPGGVVAGMVAEAEQRPCIHDRVEASSLGTPEAKAARESVPDDRVRHVVAMSRMYAQGRAEGAAEVRARIEHLADAWDDPDPERGDPDKADALRAALAAEPAENGPVRRSDGLEGLGAGGRPRWVDLFGADPDYCGGQDVNEWLDEQRGDA
jgi:hypothetical protein